MKITEEINNQYADYIRMHREDVQNAADQAKAQLPTSPLFFHGHLAARPLMMPKIYDEEDIRIFESVVSTMHRICGKVIRHYIADAAYRRLFPFSRELEELILLDPGYEDLLPMARFDIFYDESSGNYKFCEINTDGTSAQNEDRYWDVLQKQNPAHQAISQRYDIHPFELFDSWVSTFLEIYRGWSGSNRTQSPNVAIVDFMDTGTTPEFQEFRKHFQMAGLACELCDIRDLRYDGEFLFCGEQRIDAIYRRAVTSDIMAAWEDVQPLIRAVRDGRVFLCGSFRTQIPHTKAFFRALHKPETQAFLTEEENAWIREHVPYTCYLTSEEIELDEVLRNKDRYIIKPMDSYGANKVVNGLSVSREEWEETIREVYDRDFICQEYHHPYKTQNIDMLYGDGEFREFINMNGLFSYNGRFAGVYSRLSTESIIVTYGSERSAASYHVNQ